MVTLSCVCVFVYAVDEVADGDTLRSADDVRHDMTPTDLTPDDLTPVTPVDLTPHDVTLSEVTPADSDTVRPADDVTRTGSDILRPADDVRHDMTPNDSDTEKVTPSSDLQRHIDVMTSPDDVTRDTTIADLTPVTPVDLTPHDEAHSEVTPADSDILGPANDVRHDMTPDDSDTEQVTPSSDLQRHVDVMTSPDDVTRDTTIADLTPVTPVDLTPHDEAPSEVTPADSDILRPADDVRHDMTPDDSDTEQVTPSCDLQRHVDVMTLPDEVTPADSDILRPTDDVRHDMTPDDSDTEQVTPSSDLQRHVDVVTSPDDVTPTGVTPTTDRDTVRLADDLRDDTTAADLTVSDILRPADDIRHDMTPDDSDTDQVTLSSDVESGCLVVGDDVTTMTSREDHEEQQVEPEPRSDSDDVMRSRDSHDSETAACEDDDVTDSDPVVEVTGSLLVSDSTDSRDPDRCVEPQRDVTVTSVTSRQSEETLDDGSVVRRHVTTTTHQVTRLILRLYTVFR